jgi:DNA polymerase III subunit gamma/tau
MASLDIKYRPPTFDEVIGQDVIITILKHIVEEKQYRSAYLFSGPSGTGKTTNGRIFSKAILCDAPIKGNPCCKCPSCLLFQEEKHFGYMELDSASYGGKDDMIQLRDDAAFLSIEKKKIILLDECHDISKQGQDALLKQVEQCPPHLIYIFCTTEPQNIKEPLRKRCMNFQFSKVDSNPIIDRLKLVCKAENIEYEEEALQLISSRSEGHVRDAIKLLEESSYLGKITVKSVQQISCDFSDLIFLVISNLGHNLPAAIDACKKISSLISCYEFYNQLLLMVSDSVKLFYGYNEFIPQRKELLTKLRDIHGSNLLEFLNYLVTRDKFVDGVGLYSDIMLLHYKFCSNGFQAQTVIVNPNPTNIVQSNVEISEPIKTSVVESNATPMAKHEDLMKMPKKDMTKVLREYHNTPKGVEIKEEQKVSESWPLPKIDNKNILSFEEKEMSPLEFSKTIKKAGRRGL